MPDESSEKLWSVSDLAAYCGVPIATVYQWSHRNTGPRALKIGRHLRFRPSDVRSWEEQQVVSPGPAA